MASSARDAYRVVPSNGKVRVWTYDALNRQTHEYWYNTKTAANADLAAASPTYANATQTYAYAYDKLGQLTSAGDASLSYANTFDAAGNITQIVGTHASGSPLPIAFTETMTYQNLHQRTFFSVGVTNPASTSTLSSFSASSVFDGAGHLSATTLYTNVGYYFNGSLQSWYQPEIDYQYFQNGQLQTLTRGTPNFDPHDIVTGNFSYDGLNRLTGLAYSNYNLSTGAFGAWFHYGWAYDSLSRLTSFTNSAHADENATYGYDSLGQLIGADRSGTSSDESYVYDLNGNRASKTVGDTTNQSRTSSNNQIASDGQFSYSYDLEGNRLSKTPATTATASNGWVHYVYDNRDRLVEIDTWSTQSDFVQHHAPSKAVQEFYDVFDRWVGEKVYNGAATGTPAEQKFFVYDGNQIAMQLDGAGQITHGYLWGPMVDMALADITPGTVTVEGVTPADLHWLLGDNQGTIRDITDAIGQEVQHTVYDSFGNVTGYRDAVDAVLSSPVVDELFQFTGRAFSKATGEQNNWHRWYDAPTGTWLTEDPNPKGTFADGANNRDYVHNSPVNGVDYSGWADITHSHDAIVLKDRPVNIPLNNSAFHYSLAWVRVKCHAGGNSTETEIGGLELLAHDATAWGTISLEWDATTWVTTHVKFATIHYSESGTRESPIELFSSRDIITVAEKWHQITNIAKNYEYAEQESWNGNPSHVFTHWPQSLYVWSQTNSNTFVRYVVSHAGLTMYDIEPGFHPGNLLPSQNSQNYLYHYYISLPITFYPENPPWFDQPKPKKPISAPS